MTLRSYWRSPATGRFPGIRSRGRGSSWASPQGNSSNSWRFRHSTIPRPSGDSAAATRTRACPASWHRRNEPGGPPGFPPLQRAQIVRLACLEPIAKGLHITHWTSKDLARQAVKDGIIAALSDRTVRTILDEVDLQPHRTRYWRTARVDAEFKRRAEKVLWCYANADRLAKRGYWVVGVDEKPNCQVLERNPIRRSIPGSIEQQEFEYTRHGTVNILAFLIVHSGRMEASCIEAKNAKTYIEELQRFRRRHRHLHGVYLIHDGDPSHTAAATEDYLASCNGWWHRRFTPVHASWLDQAEILLNVFSDRYLKRTSWRSRGEFIEHVQDAWPEYNRLYAHPFEWTWTNRKMRRWYADHTT
jgi:DDE superfamily endonuclease